MSLGSPAITSSLMTALKVCTRPATLAFFDDKEESSEGSSDEEEMDATDDDAKEGTN